MGCLESKVCLNECSISFEARRDGRIWTYHNVYKMPRKIIIRHGGEYIGWFEKDFCPIVIIYHGYDKPVLVRVKLEVKKGKKWRLKSDFIDPSVRSFEPYRRVYKNIDSGTNRCHITVYLGSQEVAKKSFTFEVHPVSKT